MNGKMIARSFFFIGMVLSLGLAASVAIAAFATQESKNSRSRRAASLMRSRDFLCNDVLQESPLKKIATRHHPKRCNVPTAQRLTREVIDPSTRLLINLPIVHSVKFGEIEAVISRKGPCTMKNRLNISRKGKVYIDELITERFADTSILTKRQEQCYFYNVGIHQIRDLDNDREPEILVGYHTKGAHCCAGLIIYHYDANRDRYDALFHYFGEWGLEQTNSLVDLDGDGILEFDIADDSLFLAYKIGITEIWQYRQGRMYDVTRRFPKQIRQTAFTVWEHYRSLTDEEEIEYYSRGRLTLYLAYKYMLGEAEDGWKKVRQIYPEKNQKKALSEIKAVLHRLGYVPGTDRERVNLKPESTDTINEEVIYHQRGLAPHQTRLHLLAAKTGQELTVKLRDIAFEKGTINIRILSPEGRLLSTLDRYEQRRWQGKAQSSGDYIIEVYSPTGADYSLEFDIL
ncbi:hypothetical protein [Lusitaniella coriacea]|uniref:hypothetical protein n=1 Tax=Lusitaniella coriacea TaxID=1983105 RepID=UPI003CFA7CB0